MTATTITAEQIDRCERTIDLRANRVFYVVESMSNPGTHYKVMWNEQFKRLQCMPFDGEACPASKEGLVCWHMRASLEAEKEYREFKKAEREAQARIEATRQYQREQIEQAVAEAERRMAEFDNAENGTNEAARRERAALAKDGWRAYERKPFSLLK